MLEKLRNLNVDRNDLEELVAMRAFANAMAATYQTYQLERPEWLAEAIRTLDQELKTRRRDNLELALTRARKRGEDLKSADEKRAETAAEIKRLEEALAQA